MTIKLDSMRLWALDAARKRANLTLREYGAAQVKHADQVRHLTAELDGAEYQLSGKSQYERPGWQVRVEELRKRLGRARDDLAAIRAQHAKAHEEFQASGALYQRCAEFAKRAGLHVPEEG